MKKAKKEIQLELLRETDNIGIFEDFLKIPKGFCQNFERIQNEFCKNTVRILKLFLQKIKITARIPQGFRKKLGQLSIRLGLELHKWFI